MTIKWVFGGPDMSSSVKSSTIHFSHASFLMPVIQYLQDRGISVEPYLRQAGISPALLEEQDSPLFRKLIFQFINDVSEAEGIEDIALRVGQGISLQKMGEIGQWMLNTETVHSYLRRGCKLSNQVSTGDHYWLIIEGDEVRFCASVSSLNEKDTVQNYLYILLITINTISEAVGGWFPEEINLPGMSLHTAARLSKQLPHTRILREDNYASFPVPGHVLKHPLASGHRPSLENTFVVPTDFISSIRLLIKNHVTESSLDIIGLANAAGINQRTLQRRLAKCGTSFTQLLTEIRIDLAKQWIQSQDYSVAEIAARLGYNDPTNFSRAFRRVIGLSPSAYSKQLKRT
jgi:AraC-like DNA-binding protein